MNEKGLFSCPFERYEVHSDALKGSKRLRRFARICPHSLPPLRDGTARG